MDPDLLNALWGEAGLAGLQWALLDERPYEALRQVLATLLPITAILGTCRLHRAKFKPGRYLTTYYEAELQDRDTGRQSSRQIEVNWLPAGTAKASASIADIQDMQDEAIERGLAAPFRALTAEAPEWGMRLQVAPLDVQFPQLARASDPAYVGAMLASAGVEPAGADGAYDVSAIRYRPGQRHVLRYVPHDHPAGTMFAKVYNSDKGARTFSVVSRVADWLAAQGEGLRTVKPAGFIAADDVVLYPLVTGTPLSQLLSAPDQTTDRVLREAGSALAALHRTPLDVVELQPHSFAKEIKGIVSASEHIHTLLPEAGAAISALLDRARALHEQLPQEQPGFAYGDFKADHLWITPEGLTLIDFDTCYLFDPAIDLGKFLADLQWWYDVYGQPGAAAAQEQFLAGYGADAPDSRLQRARLYEALVLLKTTARRVKLFDPNWADRTSRLVAKAASVLDTI